MFLSSFLMVVVFKLKTRLCRLFHNASARSVTEGAFKLPKRCVVSNANVVVKSAKYFLTRQLYHKVSHPNWVV